MMVQQGGEEPCLVVVGKVVREPGLLYFSFRAV